MKLNDKELEKLAEDHWEKYVKILVELHDNLAPSTIKKIGFHYKTALIHGYGHRVKEEKK